MARYLVGIDLGTTNSALAYIDLQAGKGRGGVAGDSQVSRAAAGRPRRSRPRGLCCRRFSTCRASTIFPPAPPPCRGIRRRTTHCRRVRPQPRRPHSRPAGHFRQILALPCRRRSLRAAAAVERSARCAAHLARRGFGTLPAASGRQLEPRHGPRPTTNCVWKSKRSC